MFRNTKQLKKFLVEARINTYATSGEGGEQKLSDGTKEFVHRRGLYKYRDRYFGTNPFIGEEVTFYKSKPVWGMNYYGRVILSHVNSRTVYEFLKQALQKVTARRPYRGPKLFKRGAWKYSCFVQGSIDNFSGRETIYYRNKKVYELLFHGGKIR